MDPRLLQYYGRELNYVREMGAEFAREFPKVAGRLGLDTFECADPYVERLLEGFAFLSARVHLKLDDEFPRFTQHLLEIVYPHYLAPTPSMAVVQMNPTLSEGALAQGVRVGRGTVLRSLLGRGEQTVCEYRTGQDVTLWPLELVGAEYTSYVGDLGDLNLPRRAKAAVRLQLRATAGLKMSEVALDELTLFVRGSDELPGKLYEQIVAHTMATVVRPTTRPAPWRHLVTQDPVVTVGYDDDEALLPYSARSFQGYRLLQEYFAFPARFLFVKLRGLRPAVSRMGGTELEIVLVGDADDKTLDGVVSAQNFGLFCTPAANLFPRRADRIHLNEASHEYHVVPDRTRPMDYEIHSVTEVTGFGSAADVKQTFRPFYAWNAETSEADTQPYYTVHRQPRLLSARQRSRGARSSYVGSELFVSLVDPDEAPYRSNLRQLQVETICTNRDLPLHLAIGQGRTDFTLESGAPVESVRCLAGPTAPHASHANAETAWRLVSHLSLNYLSLVDETAGGGANARALRELLTLYADTSDAGVRKQIDGIRSTACAGITRALPVPGPTTFGRGLEITVMTDEGAFEGAGVFLLGAVLERFFAKYVALNSFTETVLRSTQRGEIMRWRARAGLRQLI
ncbi:MAG TPA: type VI secretion system baseplate subunit TssF [Polyangia bacterium]|nr:type VI secretion system baseplate subunit TssF [Polyangia bacterium]